MPFIFKKVMGKIEKKKQSKEISKVYATDVKGKILEKHNEALKVEMDRRDFIFSERKRVAKEKVDAKNARHAEKERKKEEARIDTFKRKTLSIFPTNLK